MSMNIFDKITVWRDGALWAWSAKPPGNDSVYGGFETETAAIQDAVRATLTPAEIIAGLKAELLDSMCPGGDYDTRECVETETCGCGRSWFYDRLDVKP